MNRSKSVYVIKNEVTNRIYVGSSQRPKLRIYSHLNLLKRGQHSNELMQSDYDAYGEQSFSNNIIGEYDPITGKRQEILVMKILRTQEQKYGYNYKDKSGNGEYSGTLKWRKESCASSNSIQQRCEQDFLSRLDLLKLRNNINNTELSLETGIPYTTIASLYEKGYENIKWKTLSRLCKYFGVTAEYLMNGEQ